MLDAAGIPEYHYVLMDYLCRPTGGTLCAADDASGVAWVSESDLRNLKITEGTPAVIDKAFENIRNRKSNRKSNSTSKGDATSSRVNQP